MQWQERRDERLWIFAVLTTFVVYGLELTSFSLSIDEEVHSFKEGIWEIWISQGRWGMGLLTWLFPEISALPYFPTLIFCLGLAAGSVLLASVLAPGRSEAFAFVGFFVSSPIWLHIGEFNTLSWGIGIAVIATAGAAVFVVRRDTASFVLACLCATLAIAVYQAMLILYFAVAAILTLRGGTFWPARPDEDEPRLNLRPMLSVAAGFALYQVSQALLQKILAIESTYVGGWVRWQLWQSDFDRAFGRTLDRLAGLFLGSDATFLGAGAVILLLPWVGLAVGLWRWIRGEGPNPRWLAPLPFLLIVGAAAGPVVMSAGEIPLRALIVLPLLYAMLGINAWQISKGKGPRWLAFGAALCAATWISTSLFYTDQLARQRDAILAQRVVSHVEAVGRETFGRRIKVVFIGIRSPDTRGPVKNVEAFGRSFFEHEGGNPTRIFFFMRLLGMTDVIVTSVQSIQGEIETIRKMPTWPAPGAVAVVNEVVVVKLGPPTFSQEGFLKEQP